jgi:LAO/AO transport system kinase
MKIAEVEKLVGQAGRLEKWPLARLISIFENRSAAAPEMRRAVLEAIDNHPDLKQKNALVIGFTGAPGVGKSSLIGALCDQILSRQAEWSIAVLAIDPSSRKTGGALLGDRTRIRFPVHEKRLFFRSQASALDLGGVSRKTFQVIRLIRHFFDFIFLETVGVGQSEVEVEQLCQHTCLVLQPFTGDQIQFIKSGVMEVPDSFIINKSDETALAKQCHHLLSTSIRSGHFGKKRQTTGCKEILLTSTVKQGGIDALYEHILKVFTETQAAVTAPGGNSGFRQMLREQEAYYLRKWVELEYGRYGRAIYEKFKQAGFFGGACYEEKETALKKLIESKITPLELIG